MKPTVLELVDKLQALGSSRQIADFFQQEKVKGQRDNGLSCVVAQYLNKASYDRYHRHGIVVCSVLVQDGSTAVQLHPLSPLSEFITDFDAGLYPALAVGPG